jgi:hypothetical protein
MKKIQNEITRGLVRASVDYGRAGLAFTGNSPILGQNPQVAIGNLGIAIELLLKAFIAKRSLLLLFKNLPLELRCALSAPTFMPQSFRSLPYEIELKSSTYISLELDEAIAAFSTFSPEIKKRLSSHLRFLSRHRNTCVHAVHPDYREYEVDRTAFLYLTLVEHLRQDDPGLIKRMFCCGLIETDTMIRSTIIKRRGVQ